MNHRRRSTRPRAAALLGAAAALALPAAVSTLHAQTATYTKIQDDSNNAGYADVNPAYGQPHVILAAFNY